MTRGVKLGTKRGCYKRFNKHRLRKLALDILAGRIDREAVAHAFQSTNLLSDRIIADQLLAGEQFNFQRLARAVVSLSVTQIPFRAPKRVPLWMAKASLRHLASANGGRGEAIHKALRVAYPYTEHPKVRAFHRQLIRDYGQRNKGEIERQLKDKWPQRKPGQFPELEKAIRASLSGYGVPLEVWRSLSRKMSLK